jgi:hypothetical protein
MSLQVKIGDKHVYMSDKEFKDLITGKIEYKNPDGSVVCLEATRIYSSG